MNSAHLPPFYPPYPTPLYLTRRKLHSGGEHTRKAHLLRPPEGSETPTESPGLCYTYDILPSPDAYLVRKKSLKELCFLLQENYSISSQNKCIHLLPPRIYKQRGCSREKKMMDTTRRRRYIPDNQYSTRYLRTYKVAEGFLAM